MILPDINEPVIVQGITGRYGSLHTKLMLQYGTNIVAGVTPGKGGENVEGVPVYDSVSDALKEKKSKSSILFVPAQNFLSAALEALNSGIKLIVAITEHVPIRDTLIMLEKAKEKGASVIGPNTPGIIVPGKRFKMGIMPSSSFKPGNIAIFSKSGTLMYEVAYQLTSRGYGQSIALGVGGDPINCTTLIECLEIVRNDDKTNVVVLVGEIGGNAEEMTAQYIVETKFNKPVVAYIAGRHAPKEKKMGHAGAIVYGNFGTAESKIRELSKAGALIAMSPSEIPDLVRRAIT